MGIKREAFKKALSMVMVTVMVFITLGNISASANTKSIPTISYSIIGSTDVGNTYEISVKVKNVRDLYGYSLGFKYDKSLMQVISVSEGDIFKGLKVQTPVKTINNGDVDLVNFLLGDVNGVTKSEGELVRLKVKSLKEGNVTLKTVKDNSSLTPYGNNMKMKISNSNGKSMEYASPLINITQKKVVSDWTSHWAKNEIQYAMNKGWIQNTNKFRPEESITRAEFIKIVNKAFGYTSKTSVPFTDVKSSEWYYNEVAIALKNGVISNKNKTFRPNDPISREEVAVILTNIKKNKDSKIDKLNKYSDKGQVSDWALTSVEGAIEAGYMGKDSTKFRPKSYITRAESVVTLYRVVK